MTSDNQVFDKKVIEMGDLLRKQGFRLTPQRLAILRLLAGSDQHPNAEQIYGLVKKDFPTTSLATIYKTISVLKQIGQILEINTSEAGTRYDISTSFMNAHLICTRCHAITDFDLPSGEIDPIIKQASEDSGYQQLMCRLNFYGICPNCVGT
ncbi:MAG TPA: Fur family transcriptional regulator [Anaerolineaceae bacterium]